MKTKKFTATVRHDLSEEFNELARKKGMTLREMQERLMENTLTAHRIAEEIRG